MILKDYAQKLLAISPFMEFMIWRAEKKRFFDEAKTKFASKSLPGGSLSDYKKAFYRHRVSFSEYMYSYEFWNLDEKKRNEFISRSEMQCIYRKMVNKSVRAVFHDKVLFLKRFSAFVYRDWMVVRESSFDEFKAMLSKHDCIAKPISGTCGEGITKICCNDVTDWKALYDKYCKNDYLLEECVKAHPRIEEFHPSSLNTIRVVTISNGENCEIFGAILRMGVHGSIIDNSHAGGVFAPINIENGIIEIDGIDGKQNKYDSHPDSHKPIKGFKIPFWDEVKKSCIKASQIVPGTIFAGWDICVLPDGRIEFIEGNHAPDFDGGMQAPLKKGVKRKMQQTVLKLTGIDPIRLINFFSKKYNNKKL